VQDRHPLLNTNNVYQASENFAQWPYEAWVLPALPADEYEEGEYVKHTDKVWISTADNNATEPGAVGATWSEINNFSQYLLNVLSTAAQKTIEKIFQYKKVERNTKTIFENIYLFDGAGNRNTMVVKLNRFVGFQIALHKHKHLAALIRKVGTQFSNDIPDPLNLYLYHSSQQDPILVIPVNVTKPVSFEWHDIDDILLPYTNSTQESGGMFYFGYYEADLPMGVQAIRRDNYVWGQAPCQTCNSSDMFFFQKWSAFMSIMPIAVQSTYLNVDKTKFSNNAVGLVSNSNFGINLHLTVKCDNTDFIIDNIEVLDEAYANQIAYELLNSMIYTLRDSGDAKQVRDKAGIELARTDAGGIQKMLEFSFKALDYDMSGFNTVCLTDSPRRGARTGAML
jgi:hypothetical protein